MKKKVLFLIHDLGQGGAEKVLVNLVNNMDREAFDITVMSLFAGGVNEQFLNKDIRYQTIFPFSFPGNSQIMKAASPALLHKLFIRERYDIEVAYLEGPAARVIYGCNDRETGKVAWIHVEQHSLKKLSHSFRSVREALHCYTSFDRIICVSEYVKKDQRFKLINKINGGASSARNVGIREACGDYITFIDSDDYIVNEIYSKCFEVIENENADVVCFDIIRIEDKKEIQIPIIL